MKRTRAKERQIVHPASVEDVAGSVRRIRAMSLAEKTALCDVIFKNQPTLLGQVLVLSKMKVPMEKVE